MSFNCDSLTDNDEYQNLKKVWSAYNLFTEKVPATFGLSVGLRTRLIDTFGYDIVSIVE